MALHFPQSRQYSVFAIVKPSLTNPLASVSGNRMFIRTEERQVDINFEFSLFDWDDCGWHHHHHGSWLSFQIALVIIAVALLYSFYKSYRPPRYESAAEHAARSQMSQVHRSVPVHTGAHKTGHSNAWSTQHANNHSAKSAHKPADSKTAATKTSAKTQTSVSGSHSPALSKSPVPHTEH